MGALKDAGVKYWPTAKLKEVIDDHYGRSEIGTDFGPILEEIKRVYWERTAREQEKRLAQAADSIEALPPLPWEIMPPVIPSELNLCDAINYRLMCLGVPF